MMTLSCPITGGRPTRMTADAFRLLCDARRRDGMEARYANGYSTVVHSRRCEWCGGKKENRPEELAIIKLEDIMAKSNGRCEICDTKTEMKSSRGVAVCATCQKIMGYVDNHMSRVAAAAKALDKTADLVAALGAPVTADPDDHAIAEAVRECFGRDLSVQQLGERCREKAENAARVEEELATTRMRLESGLRIWADLAQQLGCEQEDVPEAIRAKQRELESARARIDELEAGAAASPAVSIQATGEDMLDVALLDWARSQVDAGRISLHVEVREAAA